VTSSLFQAVDISKASSTSVSGGVEKLSYEFNEKVVPDTRNLTSAIILAQPFYDYAEGVIQNVWCATKLLWYRTDSCAAPSIEYAIVPNIDSVNRTEEKSTVVNNTYVTNQIDNSGIREIVREVIVREGQIDPGIFVTRLEYKNQVDALLRSIENAGGRTTTTISSGGA